MKKILFTLSLSISVLFLSAQTVEYTLQLRSGGCQGNVYIDIDDDIDTALEDIDPGFCIYPNPVVDELNVPLPASGEDVTVLLLDSSGRLLHRKNVSGDETLCQFFLTNYPAGIYFVQVIAAKKTTYKLIKN
jgi:hypothetical protein